MLVLFRFCLVSRTTQRCGHGDSAGYSARQVGWMLQLAATRGVKGEDEKGEKTKRERDIMTNLSLAGRVLIVAVWSGAQRRAGPVLASANTAAFGQVLLALRLADLDLLLFATTAELLRLEGALRLELGAAVLGNVAFGHGGDGFCCRWMDGLERGRGRGMFCVAGEEAREWRQGAEGSGNPPLVASGIYL
jgi:hypothetical protein